jgi:hypothetical protein
MDFKAVYNDPKFQGSLSGVNRFYKAVKGQDPTISRAQVKKALRSIDTYTLHKPIKKPPIYRRVYTKGIDYLYEIDLVDMSKFKNENDGHTFIITIIDTFSKRAWAFKLKSKTAKAITKVMTPFLKNHRPHKISFDQGGEFVNRLFLKLLKKYKIKHYHVYSDRKCSIVERFNRTLQGLMYRHFTSRGSHRYVDILQDLIDNYNSSEHSSIKMRPIDVNKRNEHIVRRNLFPRIVKEKKHMKAKFKVGDSVRVTRKRTLFQRGYEQTHSYEIFTVSKVLQTYPITYKIQDYKSNEILGSFYTGEIQLVDKSDNIWPIEKIVDSRRRGGQTEYLVKFLGYTDEANTWIPQQDLFDI